MATINEVTYTWKIPEIIWDENGVITSIKWEYIGTKGSYTSKLHGKHYITGDHTQENFIAQPDVVKADVIDWVENDFGRVIEFSDEIKEMIAGPDQTIVDIPDPEPRLTTMKKQIADTITAKEMMPVTGSRSLED